MCIVLDSTEKMSMQVFKGNQFLQLRKIRLIFSQFSEIFYSLVGTLHRTRT